MTDIDRLKQMREALQPAADQPIEWGTIQHLVKRQIPALLLQLAEKATELDEQDDDQLTVSSDFLADIHTTLDDAVTQLSSLRGAIKRHRMDGEYQGRCDTTLTERFSYSKCQCGTYPDNLGPCKTYEPGEGRCVYCDHNEECHIVLASLCKGEQP